jgi:hypothetical protein
VFQQQFDCVCVCPSNRDVQGGPAIRPLGIIEIAGEKIDLNHICVTIRLLWIIEVAGEEINLNRNGFMI